MTSQQLKSRKLHAYRNHVAEEQIISSLFHTSSQTQALHTTERGYP